MTRLLTLAVIALSVTVADLVASRSLVTSHRKLLKTPPPVASGEDAFYNLALSYMKENMSTWDLRQKMKENMSKFCDRWSAGALEDLAGPLYDHLSSENEKEIVNDLVKRDHLNASTQQRVCNIWNARMAKLKSPTSTSLKAAGELLKMTVVVKTFDTRGGNLVDIVYGDPATPILALRELSVRCYVDTSTCTGEQTSVRVTASEDILLADYFHERKQGINPRRNFTGHNALYQAFLSLEWRNTTEGLNDLLKNVREQVHKHCDKWVLLAAKDLEGPLYNELSNETLQELFPGKFDRQFHSKYRSRSEFATYVCGVWNEHMESLKSPTETILKALAEWKECELIVTTFRSRQSFHVAKVKMESVSGGRWIIPVYSLYHFADDDSYEGIRKYNG